MTARGLRQLLTPEQQRDWVEGKAILPDADERSESLEQRFKYAARFEKLLRRPQAREVREILRIYGETCLPIPRRTERYYWSVSCLPSTSDKPLARVNASWMELFTLSARAQREDCEAMVEQRGERAKAGRPAGIGSTGSTSRSERQPCDSMARANASDGLRARFILHLSDFTTDGSVEPDHLDLAFLQSSVESPEDLSHFFWKADILGVKVRGSASIRLFLANPRALRAIRRFNLTHMNRGRNAYQASHCYSLADYMLEAPSAGEQSRSDCEPSSKRCREPASGSPTGEPV